MTAATAALTPPRRRALQVLAGTPADHFVLYGGKTVEYEYGRSAYVNRQAAAWLVRQGYATYDVKALRITPAGRARAATAGIEIRA